MRTEAPAAASTQAPAPDGPRRGVPSRTHLLAAAPYTLGTSGIVGILPDGLRLLGLGLGVLLIALGALIAWRAQVRHRGRASSTPVVGGPCSASRTLTSPLRARAPMPLDKRTALRRRGLLLARAVVAHPCAHAEEGGQREREDQEEQAAGHGDHDRPSAGARSLWGAVRRGWLCHR